MHIRVPRPAITTATLLLLMSAFPARAQSVIGPAPGSGRLSVSLLGGWASFAQGSINETIRLDNLFLTAPAGSTGVGLEEGLSEITDGLGLVVEIRYRLSPHYALAFGVQRLYDRSSISFEFDQGQGAGPEPASIEYEVEDWPIYVGVYREFRFTDRVDYRLGGMLVWFPSSTLRVDTRLGSDEMSEEGTTDGLGLLLSFGGDFNLTQRLALTAATRLRLGRIGDPKDSSGLVIKNFFNEEVAPMDWSGVDIVVGLTYTVF